MAGLGPATQGEGSKWGGVMPDDKREIYVEITVQGSYAKATAIDSVTGVEASIVGPANATRAQLSDAAVRKLKFLLEKKK